VEIRNGAQDIGVGTKTILAMVAAEELGIPLARVTPFIGDTNDPIGPASGGSTTAPTIMPAARTAAFMAGRSLREVVAKTWGCTAEDLALSAAR
jgi:xanthine dehydrogenase YagR molybdenum-binding subunit